MPSGGGALPRAVYGKLTNRSRRSVAFAAPRSIGLTPEAFKTRSLVERRAAEAGRDHKAAADA